MNIIQPDPYLERTSQYYPKSATEPIPVEEPFDKDHEACPECGSINYFEIKTIGWLTEKGRLKVPLSCTGCGWYGKVRELIRKWPRK